MKEEQEENFYWKLNLFIARVNMFLGSKLAGFLNLNDRIKIWLKINNTSGFLLLFIIKYRDAWYGY